IDVSLIDLGSPQWTGEIEFPLQPSDNELDHRRTGCPQPKTTHTHGVAAVRQCRKVPASNPCVGRLGAVLVAAAGDAVAGALGEESQNVERRIMALLIQRVLEGEDVGVGNGLHQPEADIRWCGALASSPTETEPCLRIVANAEVEPLVDVDWRNPVRPTR